jgi:hypothetical protein
MNSAGSGSGSVTGSVSQSCTFFSGAADPDPVRSASFCRIWFESNAIHTAFFRKFQYTIQYIENCDTYDTEEKDKTVYPGTAVNKSKKNLIFQQV